MKTVIIHGHFYQPPRENPWSGVIEDQTGAAPWYNWNHRIHDECYEANGYSPVLNSEGKTCRIFNNYEYLSFNFGPTLLDWLRQEKPHTYEKILDADRKSALRQQGHGNALAQVYNHMIMPLASERDRKTQIEWGIRNFQFHFKRDPEGMWLAETAINNATAEDLIRAGIRFTVLSPWQAAGLIREDGSFFEVHNNPELWQKPWKLACRNGDLTVFFYHPGLSSDISFQHLLRDADNFYNRMDGELALSGAPLLPVATDGEIYGHHESLGNMGLSAFIAKVLKREDLQLSGFAACLEDMPPAGTVKLIPGEEERGSSWSCSHGVSRWYRDCGCHTGGKEGWNQKWRGPLRKALNDLAVATDRVYADTMKRLTPGDPWEIRDRYIRVLLDGRESEGFFRECCPDRSSDRDRTLFYRLLEGQKNRLFMFTSCGWFFSDISGIEPVQNMMYAARVMDLYSSFHSVPPEGNLLETLSEAVSNIPERGNGAVLYTSEKYSRKKEAFRIAAALIVNQFYDLPDDLGEMGIFTVRNFRTEERGETGTCSGILTLLDRRLCREETIPFRLEMRGRLFTRLTLFPDGSSMNYTPEELPRETREILMKTLSLSRQHKNSVISDKYVRLISQLDEWMRLSLPGGEGLDQSVRSLLHYAFREVSYLMEDGNTGGWECFRKILTMTREWDLPLPEDLVLWLRAILNTELDEWRNGSGRRGNRSARALEELMILLETARSIRVDPISHTQRGRICDIMFSTPEGTALLETDRYRQKERLFGLLDLAPDFRPEKKG